MEIMKYLIEVLVALMMIGGAGGILYGVFKGTLAFSGRTIQFLALTVALPAIILLAMESRMGSESVSGIVGVVVGFALSSMTKHD